MAEGGAVEVEGHTQGVGILLVLQTLEDIQEAAFRSCSKLVIDKLPASLTHLGSNALYSVKSMKEWSISATCTYDAYAFSGIASIHKLVLSKDMPLSQNLFSNLPNLEIVVFKDELPKTISGKIIRNKL